MIYKNLHLKDEDAHTHDFFEIVYIYSGCGTHVVNDTEVFVQRGDLLILGMTDVHSFRVNGSMGIWNCILTPDFISEELINSYHPIDLLSLTAFHEFNSITSLTPLVKFSESKFAKIENIFILMEEEFEDKKAGYLSVIKGYLNALLIMIFRKIAEYDDFKGDKTINKIIQGVIAYIEKNYGKRISLKELAAENFYNPSYFSRFFKECYGVSLTQYVNQVRIDEAKKMILETDKTIDQIAQITGFSDKKQFYKIFKELMGQLPGDLRK